MTPEELGAVKELFIEMHREGNTSIEALAYGWFVHGVTGAIASLFIIAAFSWGLRKVYKWSPSTSPDSEARGFALIFLFGAIVATVWYGLTYSLPLIFAPEARAIQDVIRTVFQ